MKRFLRYVLYREGYRHLRRTLEHADDGDDADPVEPDKRIGPRSSEAGQAEHYPIEEPADLKAVLQRMDAYDFEHFVADLWERLGWETTVSSESADRGVDVVATKRTPYEQTTLIQAKRYGPNTTVGSPEVQQYASLKNQYDGVDKVCIVTTNEFTGQARELAARLNVKLVNGDDLVDLIVDAEAADLVADSLEFVSLVDDGTDTSPREATDTASGEASPDRSTIDRTDRSVAFPSTNWHKLVAAATAGWLVVIVGMEALPPALGGFLILGSWLLLPIAIYKDAQSIPNRADWPTYTWAYVLASLVWLVAVIPGLLYLWRRYRLDAEDGDAGTNADRAPSATASSGGGAVSGPGSRATESAAIDTEAETGAIDPAESTSDASDDGHADSIASDDAVRGSSDETPTAVDRPLRTIGYRDERYACEVRHSPDGSWLIAYGHTADGEQARVFCYQDADLRFTHELEHPIEAAVADTGRAVVVDGLDADERAGKLTAYEPDGETVLTHYVNGTVGDCVITADGAYAAAVTLGADGTAVVFDLKGGEPTTTHETRGDVKRALSFEHTGDERRLLLRESPDAEPAYAIGVDGDVVWENDAVRRADRIEMLRERDDPESLESAIGLLRDRYEEASHERDRKEVARELAETHRALAAAVGGDNRGRAIAHLERATERYLELLPWYDGKTGAAKTLRERARHQSTAGNHQAALDALREIERLEAEYSVELLTDADERQLDDLAETVGLDN